TAEGFSSGKEPLTRNFELKPATVRATDGRATLNLKAKLDSETGTRLILFKGEAKAEGQTVVQYSRAIPLTVDPFPFTLANSLPRKVTINAPASEDGSDQAAEKTASAK